MFSKRNNNNNNNNNDNNDNNDNNNNNKRMKGRKRRGLRNYPSCDCRDSRVFVVNRNWDCWDDSNVMSEGEKEGEKARRVCWALSAESRLALEREEACSRSMDNTRLGSN
jgi:hypothetical protein